MTLRTFIYRSFFSGVLISVLLVSCKEDEAQPDPTISSYTPASEFTGHTMTISGKNFGTKVGDVKVFFYDGAEAVVSEVTKTAIVVTVPDNAYVGPITVQVKEKETEGAEFTVLQMCYMGNEIFMPCSRLKPLGAEGPK